MKIVIKHMKNYLLHMIDYYVGDRHNSKKKIEDKTNRKLFAV